MSLTRANVESVLIRRMGRLLEAADLDGTTTNGTNADLNDPIGWAIRQMGLAVDSVVAVGDGDVARVGDGEVDQLLDLAELRALESILTNLDMVDVEMGPRSEKWDQLAKRIEGILKRRRTQVARDHGLGLATLEGGVITLGFQEQNDATGDEV